MYFHQDGSVSSDRDIVKTIVVRPDIEKAGGLSGPYLTTADIEAPVREAISSIMDDSAPA